MYCTLRRDVYWPRLSRDIFIYVTKGTSRFKNRGGIRKHRNYLKHFRVAGYLTFVAIGLSGSLPEANECYKYVKVIPEQFNNLTRAIPLKISTAAVRAEAFLINLFYQYGTRLYVFIDNCSNHVSKVFELVYTLLGLKRCSMNAYHCHTTGQFKRITKTLVARLRHYAQVHLTD